MSMAGDKATHHSQLHRISGQLKASLFVLGLIAAGTLAVLVTEDAGRPLHAVATATAQPFAMTATNRTMAPNQRLSTDDFLSRDLSDKISSPMSGPRECRPDLGIINECTFQ
jgi:hypothetical protein